MPKNTFHHLLKVLIEGERVTPSEPPFFSVSQLRDFNAITPEELRQLLNDFANKKLLRVLNVRFYDSSGFNSYRDQITKQDYTRLGVLNVLKGVSEISQMRVDYFFSTRHVWDIRDALQIEFDPKKLEAEVGVKRFDELRELICVEPQNGIMEAVVNGDYLNTVSCKIRNKVWKLLYELAKGHSVLYDDSKNGNKASFDYLKRGNSKIFSKKQLPGKPLVRIEDRKILPATTFHLKLTTLATFRRMKTVQAKNTVPQKS